MQPFRVLIVDDHAHAREGMKAILELDPTFEVIGEARNGSEAIQMTEVIMPDIIIMDIQMPGIDGLEATRQIKERFPYVKIVIATVSDDIMHLFEALKRGAQGYLVKNLHPASWHEYLKAIAIDEAPMSRELAVRILQELSTPKEMVTFEQQPLTSREQEILQLVGKGDSNRDIAEFLHISENTVKNHLKNILHKLHAENRVHLMRIAYEKGWIQVSQGGKSHD